MPLEITDPKIVERGPYCVVGRYAVYEGDNEGPAWGEASQSFDRRKQEVPNRVDDALLAFLYRPHKDDTSVGEDVRSCFMGVEVTDFDQVPEGMATTRFSGGKYVTVQSVSEDEGEAAMGIGQAIQDLMSKWIPDNGYREGDACFCFCREGAETPPYVHHVYIKVE